MRQEIKLRIDTKILGEARKVVKQFGSKNMEIDDVIETWLTDFIYRQEKNIPKYEALYDNLRELVIKGNSCPSQFGMSSEYENCALECEECKRRAIEEYEKYERIVENDE